MLHAYVCNKIIMMTNIFKNKNQIKMAIQKTRIKIIHILRKTNFKNTVMINLINKSKVNLLSDKCGDKRKKKWEHKNLQKVQLIK